MAISCAYCGGEHAAPADVRRCWEQGGRQEIELPVEPGAVESGPIESEPVEKVRRARPKPVEPRPGARAGERAVERGVAPAGAGPDQLGRHAVVEPGGSVPAPWASAERVRVDLAAVDAGADLIARLRGAAHGRRRLVLELHPEVAGRLERTPMLATDAEPWRVGPTFTFVGDELHHLLWSNSVDLRGPAPSWLGLDVAVAGGCRPVGDGSADAVLADGTRIWIDGGPLRHHDPIGGVPVVHTVAIEHAGSDAVPPAPNLSAADLAPDQLAAVTHDGGAARIIAPAGSGKTRVLTERARHLLRTWHLPPSSVTLLAFNKRAQIEMAERTPDLPGLQIRTLNSVALAIVNGTPPFAPRPRRWSTIDEPDVRRIIGDLVRFPRRRNSDPIAPWIEALGLVRLGLVDPAEVESRDDGDIVGFADVWPRYRDVLDRRGVVDFDDQIYRAIGILLSDPVARRTAQIACRALLVDEFQDLTPAHLLLVRLLAGPGAAVFGVGDDDQTIYGYNGADPGWLIGFADLFPGAGELPLEINYRCPAPIVEAADRLLRHNRRRVPKTIRAAADDAADGGTDGGVGWRVDDRVDPVGATLDAVGAALEWGAAPGEIAVLTRVNAVLAPVQVALSAAGVPIAGGVGLEFLDRTSVRAVLAWLRLATADRLAEADLAEALRRPSRSFHPRIADWIAEQRTVTDLVRLAGRLNNERDAERLTAFAADVRTLKRLAESGGTTSDLVLALDNEIGLGGAVSTLDSTRRGMNRSSQGDDLTAVRHLAALHDDPAGFGPWLEARLAVKRSPDGVVLATVHRVKGQEWPHVVVHHADRDQYPHRLADDVEEERRLFHVALTRASRHATIVTGPTPSPFVAELTTEPSADRVVRSHRPDPPPARRAASTSDPTADLDPAAAARFERLKALRTRLADGKPAYVVFDNKTLAAIARTAPSTRQELARISGVGPAKLDKYGAAVLELLGSVAADAPD